jgi:hypothetical protein
MATGVYFGSPRSLILQPGAYTVVDASALGTAAPFAYNVVCVMGAGLGGTPMQPLLFSDPLSAQSVYGAQTPLAEAIRMAFMGGANGGASAVVGMRVDNCGQAYGSIPAANGGAELYAKFNDYGAYGNTFALSFYPGSVAGYMAVLAGTNLDGTTYQQKIDNETSFSNLVERINTNFPIELSVVSGGTFASQTITLATSQVDGRATVTDAQGTVQSNQAYAYQYPQTMLANVTDSLMVTYQAASGWAISSIDISTETWTTATSHTAPVGGIVRFTGTTLPPEVDTAKSYVVRLTTGTTLQVAEVLTTPQDFSISALTGTLFTAPGNTLADGDAVTLSGTQLPGLTTAGRVYFVRDKSGNDFRIAATVNGTAIAVTAPINAIRVTKIAGGLLNISGAVSGARVILQPGLTVISASNPTTLNGTRQAVRSLDAYSQTITNAILTATAYGSDTERITLQGSDTWGNTLRRGLPGTIFEIASGTYTGTYQILHQEWDGLGLDKVRVVRKLTGDRVIAPGTVTATLAFWGAFQFPRTGQPATDALETLLPANGLLTTGGQYLTAMVGDKIAYYATLPGNSIQTAGEALAAAINVDPDMPVVAATAYNAGTYTSTITLSAKKAGTVPNAYAVNLLVNVNTTLLVGRGGASLAGGTDPLPPRNVSGVTTGSLLFQNGFDSVPTYQRWLDGLDAAKYLQVRWMVPVGTDNIGVQLAFADHCELMSSTAQRRERVCILGHGNGWTEQQIRDRAELFQSERVVFVSPAAKAMRLPDSLTGNLKSYPMHYAAAIVAGALAAEGNGISDPITHTFLRNVQLEGAYQGGSAVLDRMLASGVLTFERDPSITRDSRGYRITRGITTWRVTGVSALKSSAFEQINIITQSDFVAASIREMEESLFIGGAIYPDTLSRVTDAVNAELRRLKTEKVIYGYDSKFTQASLSSQSANAIAVAYRIYPLPGLDFILNTQILSPITNLS